MVWRGFFEAGHGLSSGGIVFFFERFPRGRRRRLGRREIGNGCNGAAALSTRASDLCPGSLDLESTDLLPVAEDVEA